MALQNMLMTQPIAVYVDANNMQHYHSGVFSNCGSAANMGMLLVGMNDSYWKLKNAWGPSWGEGGYIRLTMGSTCGICQMPSYPYVGWG